MVFGGVTCFYLDYSQFCGDAEMLAVDLPTKNAAGFFIVSELLKSESEGAAPRIVEFKVLRFHGWLCLIAILSLN